MREQHEAGVCAHHAWAEGPPAQARTSASTLLSNATMMSFLQRHHFPTSGRKPMAVQGGLCA